MTSTLIPLVIAALAVAGGLVYPAADRWGWAAAAMLVGAWVVLAGEPGGGGNPVAGGRGGHGHRPTGEALPTDFNSIVGRLASLGLGILGALVLVIRLFSLDAGLDPQAVLLAAIGLAAVLHLMARPGPRAESRTARTAVVAGAAGWAVTGRAGLVPAAGIAVLLVVLAVAGAGAGAGPAGRGLRAGRLPRAAVPITLAAAVVVVLLLPPDAWLGPRDAGLSLGGLSRASILATAWVLAVTILAGASLREPLRPSAWIVGVVAVGIALLRFPLALSATLLAAAIVLPRLAGPDGAAGWSRTLVLAALGGAAAVAAGVAGRSQGDDAIAAALLLGFLALAGAVPFGWHLVRWMEEAPPHLAALVGSAFLPGALAALGAAEPALSAVHAGHRAGLVLGMFGGVTAILGALYAMGATEWRTLAVRTIPCEVGLAMVSLGAFDIRGLQGAALTLALLAITRPALLYADALSPRRGAGLVVTTVALLGAAGLPPTLGFPARVLVLSSATRIGTAVAALAVVGVLMEVAAIAIVLRRRLAQPAARTITAEPLPLRVLAGGTALALLGGGVFPAAVLHFAFQLGG